MKILILDNYDSFTYNLVQMVEQCIGKPVDVRRNDDIALEDIAFYDKIILSPGPGIPSEAGILLDLIKTYAPTKSILGVCLGHQAIAESFGAKLINLDTIYHGVATEAIQTEEHRLLSNLPEKIEVGRYHSWAVDRTTLPKDIIITAQDEKGMIMSLKHIQYDLHGVQYHPESILTPLGKQIIQNFLNY